MAAYRVKLLFLSALCLSVFSVATTHGREYQGAPNGEALQPTPADSSLPTPIDHTAASETSNPYEGCYQGCNLGCEPCVSPEGRFWFRADALMWWTNGTDYNPLVTSNSQGNDPIINTSGTQVVFGDANYLNGMRGGIRLTFGGWLDRCHKWGLEGDWLSLGGLSVDYSNYSTGIPATGRPFFNTYTNAGDYEVVAQSSYETSGTVSVHGSDYFNSAGAWMRYNLCCCSSCGGEGCSACGGSGCDVGCEETGCGGKLSNGCVPSLYGCRTDLLVGYRYLVYGDNLSIQENLYDARQSVQASYLIHDNFTTRNEFNGAEIGLDTKIYRGRWSLGVKMKMALGNNHEKITINGTTDITQNGSTTHYDKGVFTSGTNSTNSPYQYDRFVVIPSLGVELGYQLTCRLRTYVGYDMLYWAPVAKAGDQMDLNIDPRNLPRNSNYTGGYAFPEFMGRVTDLWVQGINIGAEYRF